MHYAIALRERRILCRSADEPLSRNFLLDFHSFYGMSPPVKKANIHPSALPPFLSGPFDRLRGLEQRCALRSPAPALRSRHTLPPTHPFTHSPWIYPDSAFPPRRPRQGLFNPQSGNPQPNPATVPLRYEPRAFRPVRSIKYTGVMSRNRDRPPGRGLNHCHVVSIAP